MSLLCVALVGKANEPLYFFCKEEASESLHLQMIAHSALDIMEEKKRKSLQSGSNMELYLGLLFPTEDYRVYGCHSNSQHKIIAICDGAGPEYPGMKETILSVASAFVSAVMNPFQEIGKPLRSKKLDGLIQAIIAKQNAFIPRSASV